MYRRCCLPLLFLMCPVLTAGAADLPDGGQAELRKLQGYVAEVREQVAGLQDSLRQAEERNRLQSALIDQLEAALRKQQAQTPGGQARLRREFFASLAGRLPLTPVYRVDGDRIVVAADPVFVFSRASLGAEGESRLQELADALREALAALPGDLPWRLRIEGHTDPRPLRSNREFPTNWELSAARATEVLRYLVRQGLPEDHLEAVALAATVPLTAGQGKADYRRERRIELHLEFPAPSAPVPAN